MADRIKGLVVSLFDYSGNAVRDWARAGYRCLCVDIQHDPNAARTETVGEGEIYYLHGDLWDMDSPGWAMLHDEVQAYAGHGIRLEMVFGWPPCEDMTVSGNRHLAAKREADPDFQARAARRAQRCAIFAESWGAPYLVENPIGALCTLWRKPDVIWNPCDFGGHLPEDDAHPRWPDYIAPRDAYTKKTGAWCGGGFMFPEARPVAPEVLTRVTKSGRTLRGSRQFFKLGGKTHKTKTIRNETPRGFARAVFEANADTTTAQDLWERRMAASPLCTRAVND